MSETRQRFSSAVNVTFHTLTALATAAVLSSECALLSPGAHYSLRTPAIGFGVGVMVHGVLDCVPHSYPIRSDVDVVVSLALFACAMICAKKQNLTLLAACFLGAIVPDVLDLAPAIVNHHLGWSLPVVKLFPWHWRRYSGSIYDGSRAVESLSLHLVVVALSAIFLYANRRSLFSFGREHGHVTGEL